MTVKTMNVREEYGKEVAILYNKIAKTSPYKVSELMDEFVEKNGSRADLVGSLTSALLKGCSKDKDEKHKWHEGYAIPLRELAEKLNQSNQELRRELGKRGVKVDTNDVDLNSLFKNIISGETRKVDESMQQIKNGYFLPTKAGALMEGLMELFVGYGKSDLSRSEIGDAIRSITYNLAEEHSELERRLRSESFKSIPPQ